jgi:hypothetical protein
MTEIFDEPLSPARPIVRDTQHLSFEARPARAGGGCFLVALWRG